MFLSFKFRGFFILLAGLFLIVNNPKAFSENDSISYSVDNKYIKAQHELLAKNKLIKEIYSFSILGREFYGYPTVFSPKICGEKGFFVQNLPIKSGDYVLEIGAGTGFFAVFAVLQGASHVVAVDINPLATQNIKHNAYFHGMESKITEINSDIFSALPDINGGKYEFDVIYWNIPFTPSAKNDLEVSDLMVFDPQFTFLERYLAEAGNFLKPNGRLYLGYSSTHGDVTKMKELAQKYHWRVELVAHKGSADTIIVELFEFFPDFK